MADIHSSLPGVGAPPFPEAARRDAPAQGSWFQDCLARLEKLKHLPPNWDSYGSPPPTREAYQRAAELLSALTREEPAGTQLCPVPGGGVQLEWQNGERGLELEVLPTGAVEFLKADGAHMEEGPLAVHDQSRLHELMTWLFPSDPRTNGTK